MRTIKFRGRSRKTGEWLVGDLLQVANEVFIAPSDGDWFDFIPWTKNNVFHLPSATYQVIPATVGQFTGLLDKNGKEIYEGDIVDFDNYLQGRSIVKFADGNFRVSAINYETIFTFSVSRHTCVIGNIHDNPELLKQND